MRQPVQTLYGGAHLFRPDSILKLGGIARKALLSHGPFGSNEKTQERVVAKLETEPIEDLRIDFEDGYGVRSDEEEDRHAIEAARNLSIAGPLPPFVGIRIRSFAPETRARAERTLKLFLDSLTRMPPNFAVTLPKISLPDELAALSGMLSPEIAIEAMIETPAILSHLRELPAATEGRLRGAHFGPYDFASECGILSVDQDLHHPLCDTARHQMVIAFAGTKVTLADGPTKTLPLGNDRKVIQSAWQKHYENIRRSIQHGFFQSWDLHPAQLPARYAAVYDTYLENLEPAAARLRNFLAQSSQATALGVAFDDAATMRGYRIFFERAVACGAVTEEEVRQITQ
jgi:citrate lyase beta subunit